MSQPLQPRTRLPVSVWWAVAAWACLMASWTLLLPTYRSADEAWHLDAARQLADGKPWPGFKEMRLQHPVYRSLWNAGLGRDPNVYTPLLAQDAVRRSERPGFNRIGEDRATRIVNQMAQHPPGYYGIAAGILRMLPQDLRYDAQVWLLRMFGVLLMVPLPLLAALAVRRLGGNASAMSAAALLPLCIPQLAASSAGMNSDGLLNAASAMVILGAVFAATGDLRLRVAGLLGLALGLALFTKAWALLLVPFVILAYGMGGWRTGRWRMAVLALVITGLVSAWGGWWWLANLAKYGTLQPAGHFKLLPEPLLFAEQGRFWLEVFFKRLPTRFIATLSIKPANPFPLWLCISASVVVTAGALATVLRRRSFAAGRLDGLLLCGPFLLAIVVLMANTWDLYSRTGALAGIQGRYLYFAACGFAAAFGLGVAGSLPARVAAWLPVGLWVAFAVLGIAAQKMVLEFHWGGPGAGFAERVAAMQAWSPAPGWIALLAWLGLGIASLGLLASLLAATRRDHRVRG